MANVRVRPETGKLYFDFHYRGVRCREYTLLEDSATNRRRMKQVLEKIQAEITLGTFDYRKYFPESKGAARFDTNSPRQGRGDPASVASTPLFKDFALQWFAENEIRWRKNTQDLMNTILSRHLIPFFGDTPVHAIDKGQALQFRSNLAKLKGRSGNTNLAPKTINHVMGTLRCILEEAADRYQFKNPLARLERLKVQRQDIEPFSIEQVRAILAAVRPDYRDYLTVRFFTGMRSGEVHGLKWKHIDFERRQILIRETWTHGRTEYTKTDGSQREIEMSQVVYDALKSQQAVSAPLGEYVFCTREGGPLDTKNVTNRVWYPLLRHLGFKLRRPYQMRHTCATLWLAAGENPEWIARQLGHTSTEMLFHVYSRYVPNLTRKDGSAFDRLMTAALAGGVTDDAKEAA